MAAEERNDAAAFGRSSSCSDESEVNGNMQTKPRRSSLMCKDKPRVKKSVSFYTSAEERRVSNAGDCLRYMQTGCELKKIRNGRAIQRFYFLTDDMREIRWLPTSKKYNRARVLVESVKELQHGLSSELQRSSKDVDAQDECTFSIVYGHKYESLSLVARSPDEANIWIAGLSHLIAHRPVKDVEDDSESNQLRDRWLTEVFQETDEASQGTLPEFEVIAVIRRLNPTVAVSHLRQRLKELYTTRQLGTKGLVNCEEFITLYKDVASRQEIYFLLAKYAGDEECLTADNLSLFLETEQGVVGVSSERCEELICKYEPTIEGKRRCMLGIDGFQAYLLSSDCDIFHPKENTVHQDMTHPLSDYYIASSHKTYLSEDQLKGPSCAEACARALSKGCRYIEVDCWDGPDGQPVVFHGRTLTSKVGLKDVLDVINRHAFDTSELPLILALENHCSPAQQAAAVSLIKDAFGEKLHFEALDRTTTCLPSPESLKNRIVVKSKKLPEAHAGGDQCELSEEDEDLDSEWHRAMLKKVSDPDVFQTELSGKKRTVLTSGLSDLVSCCESARFDSLQSALKGQKPWQVCSYSEAHAVKLMTSLGDEFSAYCRDFLTRVYPNISRIDSSNFNPQDMWSFGCQIVAMNYQTPGVWMDVNTARFRQNGSCGYVLKPSVLRDRTCVVNPCNMREPVPGIVPQMLQLKIISGYQFPKPRGSGAKGNVTDPYVLIEIYGLPADSVEARTRTVLGNGFNPFFDETFTFHLSFPEVALVRFVVLDDEFIGDEFIAQYAIPFVCMQTGYRHINLLNNCGEPIPNCTLFVHVSKIESWDTKPSRKGSNVSSKAKISRETVHLRPYGIKALDDSLKPVHSLLNDVRDLKYNVRCSMQKLREACDVGSTSGIKQCLRVMASRASSAASSVGSSEGGAPSSGLRLVPSKSASGIAVLQPVPYPDGSPLPDFLRKTVLAYQAWISDCTSLVEQADTLQASLIDAKEAIQETHGNFDQVCAAAGLKEKKVVKATESIAWNLHTLREQADLLAEAKLKCLSDVSQVEEVAASLGLTSTLPSTPT